MTNKQNVLLSEVYPRVCGGTERRLLMPIGKQGLSPRVRGNPMLPIAAAVYPGSIPACAGEPQWYASSKTCSEVYPRVCGGTLAAFPNPRYLQGLSPRVRGNR